MWHTIVIVLAVAVTVTLTDGCIKRPSVASGDDDGHYCVCNATYCDQAPDAIKPLNPAEYVLITSSKSGLRFNVSNGVFEKSMIKCRGDSDNSKPQKEDIMIHAKSTIIIVNKMDTYQEILGFGGAVTDAAAINILNLTHEASENLLRSYFGPHGIDYNIIRTPMGGSDFSTRTYTYAMKENDISLENFNLQQEDYDYKIPVIKRAQHLKSEIKLLTAPWTASPWMKTNNNWTSTGKLRPEYRQLWADYFIKYFQAYRNAGLEFWGLTPQNEPVNYIYIPLSLNFPAMKWTAEEERDWIVHHLSPTLKRKGFEHIKIFSLDDNRLTFPDWPEKVFHSKKARDIVSGIALHFYFDEVIGPHNLNEMKRLFPEKSLIYTEACIGSGADEKVILGSWARGELYAKNIIENLSHWVSAWIDWNLALNMIGGPNYVENYVDSPIIVNSTADEFYKQPMFYALGHFSKYIPPNSVRIGTTTENENIKIHSVALSTPDNGTVLVILNRNEEEKEVFIEDSTKGITRINVPGKSISTMKYW